MANEKSEYVLELKDIKKYFAPHKTLSQTLAGKKFNPIKAVDGVSFSLKHGEIFGLIGESGSGKTTIGKIAMKLLTPTEGQLIFDGEDVTEADKERTAQYRRQVQMIFQDPYASMNPHFKIRDVLEEPLIIHKIPGTRAEHTQRIIEALTSVKVTPPEEFMNRYPHMLSGGQKQRVATARTLILQPDIVVADEPVSMIDLSTRAEILHMMREIQEKMGLTYLYITHDLSMARYFTDRIAVMYLGRIMEIGNADDIVDRPMHPYTRALIEAVPEPHSGRLNVIKELPISGEIPSPANIPSGCRFHTRCPYATEECANEPEPVLMDVGNGHFHACRRSEEIRDQITQTKYEAI